MLLFLVKLLFYLIRFIPVRVVGALGAGLGRVYYYMDRRHRKIALKNLLRVYPEKSADWRTRTAREACAELGRTSLELPHVFLRSREFLLSRIEISGEELLKQALSQKKGVILAACHHSNWELGALSISMLGYKANSVYRSIRQQPIDHFIVQARGRFGATLQARNKGLRWLPRAIKENSCIGLMIDQHLSSGLPVPFLGHLANTTTLPATIHNKYHTPIMGIALQRIGRSFSFQLKFWPIDIDIKDSNESNQMQLICDSFAPLIHARPELWLWIHRRWLYLDEQETAAR